MSAIRVFRYWLSHLRYHLFWTNETESEFNREFEKQCFVTFWLQVTARETYTSPRRSAIATVMVTVEDGNDNKPVFTSQNYQTRVPEDAPEGRLVTTVTVSQHNNRLHQ